MGIGREPSSRSYLTDNWQLTTDNCSLGDAIQGGSDHPGQLVGAEGLGEQFEGVVRHVVLGEVGRHMPAHEQHAGRRVPPRQSADEFDPAHDRHDDIGQHEGERVAGLREISLIRGVRRSQSFDTIACSFEARGDVAEDVRLVVHDEDSFAARRRM